MAVSALLGGGKAKLRQSMDAVDVSQQVDIERLISNCLELQDRCEPDHLLLCLCDSALNHSCLRAGRVEDLEKMHQHMEERSKDRLVALRALLPQDKRSAQLLTMLEVRLTRNEERGGRLIRVFFLLGCW